MRRSLLSVSCGTIAAFVFGLTLAGCQDTATTPSTTVTGLDVNGGTWKPVVLTSASQVSVPEPAAVTSPVMASELAAVKAVNANVANDAALAAQIRYWDSSAVIRWNDVARMLVKTHKTNPPMASRVYSLLSVAQYDASVAAWSQMYRYNRTAPYLLDAGIQTVTSPQRVPSYPSDHATIAGASAAVLTSLYPMDKAMIDSLVLAHESSRVAGGYNYASDVRAGDSLGRQVASIVMAKAVSDGSDAVWHDTIPVGPQYWRSSASPAQPPLLPLWGKVSCWLITDMKSVEVSDPPAFGSPAFLDALHTVRQISDTRTPEQIAIAKKWSDDPGNTSTPPGHWNAIASDAMITRGWSMLRQAHAMALMNLAMMDAGVCCWVTKYKYWLIRPSQADTMITVAVPLPNFPSYCSGHSSFSGSASSVLAHLMPDQATNFTAMAQEASVSRVYGGIHYPFDCDNALAMGRKVGALAVARAQSDGSE